MAGLKKPLGQIIKRRIRLHEPALKALTICIVFVFTGIFLRFSTPLLIPNLGISGVQTESFEYTEQSETSGESLGKCSAAWKTILLYIYNSHVPWDH